MLRILTRAAALWAVCSVVPGAASAQHEHHGAPAALDTLTAAAGRSAFRLRSGATVVAVRGAAAAGGTIADLLRTVPGVDIDGDGRISIRGSTSVLVLVNGRRIPLNGDALAAFLRQTPAAGLERIEAGSAVSARLDANGAAGVVNLVFLDDAARRTGMRSLAGSVATEDHYLGSAAATGYVSDILKWDAMYSLSGLRPHTESKTTRWTVLPGDLPFQTAEQSRARARHRLHSFLAGASAALSPDASLAVRGTYSWMEGEYRNSSAFVYMDAAGNRGTSATGSLVEHVIPTGELGAVANVARGRFSLASELRASVVDEDFRGDHQDVVGGYSYLTSVMASRQRGHVLRNDVAVRLGGIAVDLGQESQFRTIRATHDATHFDASVSGAYGYRTRVHAGYMSAQGSAHGVHAEAGLRLESERIGIRLDSVITGAAVRLFPSVSAAWTDEPRHLTYRLAFARRISRPGLEMLNPYSMGEDDMNQFIGNPSLLPEVSDQVELGVERRASLLTLQLTPFVRLTRDPIRPLKAITASGRSTTTLKNLHSASAAGADASVRGSLTDGAVVTLVGSIARMKTRADAFSSSGVDATARLVVDFHVADNATVQFYAYRRSAQVIEQGEILPVFTSELAFTQRLLGDRGRMTVRLSDPFRTDRLEFRVADEAFTQESRRRTSRPLLSLFASYAVGAAPREDVPVRSEGPARIF